MGRRTRVSMLRRIRPLDRAMAGPAVITGVLLLATALSSTAAAVTIGVVRDGPSVNDAVVDRVEEQLAHLVPSGVEVSFKRDPAFDAGWDPARVRPALSAALRDREVDIVLISGLLALQEAVRPDLELAKPVVAATVLKSDLFRDPGAEGPFLKDNLNFTVVPHGTDHDIQSFGALTRFDGVRLLIDSIYLEHLQALPAVAAALADSLGIEIDIAPVTGDLAVDLARFGTGDVPLLLTSLPRFPAAERRELIDSLTVRRSIVFSLEGHPDVERGAVAGFTPDLSEVLARRVAINLSQIARGTPVENLPVILPASSDLLLNGRTMQALGIEVDYMVLARAEVLHGNEILAGQPSLTLMAAMQQAELHNLSLMVANQGVAVAEQDANRARSTLLPQINADADYANMDPRTLNELIPTQTAKAGFSGSQMLYDDRRISDYRAQKRLHEGSQEERETVRLDVLRDAGIAYLEYVLAQALFEVDADNLELTEDHLELARRRFEVGYSGRDEVFRWEAEVAQRRAQLYGSASIVEAQRIALNQVIGIDQSKRWIPVAIDVDPEIFPLFQGRLDAVYVDRTLWERFREFIVTYSVENAPELGMFNKSAEAQDIRLGQRKRRFFLPTLDARGAWDYMFYRNPEFDDIEKDFYRFEVVATYPLFEGGRRVHDIKKFSAELEGIERQTQLASDLVERRTRTALRRVESSFPTIDLNRQAAVSSRRNLDVVRDKYAQGIVNVTDLLEAQNQNFTADRNATVAVYEFLSDLLDLQRSIAWIEEDHTQAERDEIIRRIMEAISAP